MSCVREGRFNKANKLMSNIWFIDAKVVKFGNNVVINRRSEGFD